MNQALGFVPFAGFFGVIFATRAYSLLNKDLWLIFGLLTLPIVVFLMYLRGKEKQGEDIRRFFPVTTWVAFIPLCAAVAFLANGALDRSPVEPHTAVVIKMESAAKGATYRVQVSSWRPGRSSEWLHVSKNVFVQFQVHDPITVEMHTGALGIPWVGTVHKPKAAPEA